MYETTASRRQPEPGDELDLRLLRGRRGHGGLVLRIRVLPAAALLTAVQLLITGSRLARSWWWQDDLNLLATAARRPLSPGLLLSDYNGHLVPGSWVIAWILDRIAPLQWWPAALLTAVTVLGIDLMLLALLRRLFGDRPAILVPYAMFCSTSLTLTATLWWAAALQWLPVTLSLLTALWFHVGYLRDRRRSQAFGALAAVLFGLLFFEKALTTPVVLALFTVLYAVPGRWWSRPWRALRRDWGYWLAQAVLAGGFLWLYLSRVTIETGAATKTAAAVKVTRLMVLDTLLPSLIGGPLHWFSKPKVTVNAWPDPSIGLVLLAAVLTALAVIGSLIFIRGAWRAWVLLAAFVGFSIVLVVRARLGFIGTFVGRDHRYLTDAAAMAPLALALAWLPLRDDLSAVTEPEKQSRSGSARRRAAGAAWLARHRWLATVTAVIAVLVMTAGGLVSGETFMHVWTKNPSQAYLDNLSAGLAAHQGPVYLFGDEVVPDLVMTPTFLADRRIGHVTRPMAVRPRVQNVVPYFSVVDATGHLHNGTVRGYTALIGKQNCARNGTPAVLRLPTVPGPGQWKLRLGYLANRQTTARVSVGTNPPVTMRLERGLNQVYVSLLAGGSARIRIEELDQDAAVCLGSATLGLPVAAS